MAEEMLIQKFINDELRKIIKRLRVFDETGLFLEPVVQKWPSAAREYRARIKEPMDLQTMEKKVKQNKYKFFQLDTFINDVTLIGTNCMEFNRPRPGDTNQFYIAGETFMQRSLAYVSPIVEALRRNVKGCREGEFGAPEIAKGIDYTEKPIVKNGDKDQGENGAKSTDGENAAGEGAAKDEKNEPDTAS